MKDDSMTPSDSTIPPQSSPPPQPVAPKDSLSVEVEDLKTRFLGDEHNSIGDIFDCIKRLFEIVDELRKENAELTSMLLEAEAIMGEEICGASVEQCGCVASKLRAKIAALFDGKEGGK